VIKYDTDSRIESEACENQQSNQHFNLGINGLHRSMDELIVQFNDLVARCEECEKLDAVKKPEAKKPEEDKSQKSK